VVALEQCGGTAMFLQAAMVVVCQCPSFVNDPSTVPMVAAMASATRAQLATTEGQTLGKELKAENKVVLAKLAKASPAPAEMKEALHMGSMEGSIYQVASTPPPPSSPSKRITYSLLRPDDAVVVFFRAWMPLAPMTQGRLHW
jgi:hypothetical protein